jgi:hypothetical protein
MLFNLDRAQALRVFDQQSFVKATYDSIPANREELDSVFMMSRLIDSLVVVLVLIHTIAQ